MGKSDYVKRSDVRRLLLHNTGDAAIAALDELEGLDPELTKAVELLQMNYQCAKQMEYVQRPLPFALYATWKEFDGKCGVSRAELD